MSRSLLNARPQDGSAVDQYLAANGEDKKNAMIKQKPTSALKGHMTLRRGAMSKQTHRDEGVRDPRSSYSIALQGHQRSDIVEMTGIRRLSRP